MQQATHSPTLELSQGSPVETVRLDPDHLVKKRLLKKRLSRRRPGRRTLVVVAAATVLVLAGGGIAVADAHKTVTLDVDGRVRTVSTFAGSVSGLLDQQGITLRQHDTVSATGRLHDGATVVVRHAHQLDVLTSDGPTTVWSTDLTAQDALTTLATKHDDVALVATRDAKGRPQMPLALADRPAEVVADGATVDVSGDTKVSQALADAGVTLEKQDEVTVVPAADSVQVVVVRVVTQDVTTTTEIPYTSSTTQDPDLTEGTSAVVTAGVPGVRTVVERVTTADGAERSRETLSDEVTTAPVDEVIAVGTKPKPKPLPAPAPAPSRTSTPSQAPSSSGTAPSPSGSASGLNWAALAACESGGNPARVSSNGKYYGLYQFSVSTWQSVGGSGLPSQASAAEQTQRAQMLYARSGAGQWPACGPRLFG